jgi:hypothetical protein
MGMLNWATIPMVACCCGREWGQERVAAAEKRDATAIAGGVSHIVGDMFDHNGLRVRGRECCTSICVGARTLVKCATSMVDDALW